MKKLLKLSMLSCGVAMGIMASSGAIAQGACTVDYASVNSWGSGAQIKTTVTNTSAAKTSWELCWTYVGNDTIANLWDGVHTQTGKKVCVKSTGYNANLPANGSTSFGFIVNNPGTIPTIFTLNGTACGRTASSVASSTPNSKSSSVPSSKPSSSRSSASGTAARWLLDPTNSTFNFVTVKKSGAGVETPESMTFTQLQGTVSTTGQATLTIPLASISSGVALRNERLQSMLFESNYLPNLHFTTQLDLTAIEAMAAGTTRIQSLTGNLVLHGIVKSISFDALVVKHANSSVSFSPRKPIIINSTDFDLNAGVEALRALMTLSTISEAIPVYFKMILNRDNPSNVPAISLAAAPSAATGLTGTVSNATGTATLNWADVSSNETGFLVRRKGADGRWVTASNNAANTVSYNDSLDIAGTYDYKVISYTQSVPAVATAPRSLVYAPAGMSASSKSSISSTSKSATSSSKLASQPTSSVSSKASSSAAALDPVKIKAGQREWESQCDTCHGFAGEGTAAFNRAIDVKKFTKASLIDKIVKDMPLFDPAACNLTCAQNITEFILSNYKRDDGATAPGALQCKVGELDKHKNSPIRLLTTEQYAKLIKSVFAPLNINTAAIIPEHLLKDTALAGFASNSGIVVDVNIMPDHMVAAETIAKQVNANFSKLMTCTPSADCATKYITQYGTLLFREVPNAQEIKDLGALYTLGGAAKGIEYVTTAMLMSPKTLYHYEEAVTTRSLLKGKEIAHKLSFLIWNSVPDPALLQAAKNGSLNTPAGILAEANRMLNAAQGAEGLRYFYGNLLQLDPKKNIQQGNTTVSAQQVSDDIVRFVSYLTRKTPGTYADLLTSTKAVVDDKTAVIYGVPSAHLTNALGYMGGKEVDLDPRQRAGLLTRIGYVMLGGGSVEGLASPTERGKHVRQALLCQELPSAPGDVDFPELPDPSKKTWVEVLKEVHLANPNTPCHACHVLMDPLGFAFENYSNTGRYIGIYPSNKPIDSTGQFYAINSDKTDLDNARFKDALDLSNLLSTSDKAKSCFAEKWLTNALARDVINQEDSCAYEKLLADFKTKNYSLRELILAVVTNPSFRYRNPE